MRTGLEIRLGIVSILLFQFVTAFGTIGLLGRMAPAIEDIIERNVVSLVAVEEMLAVLARSGGGVAGDGEELRFRQALERAEQNVTEEAEGPKIGEVRKHATAALSGDAAATVAEVQALEDLGRINREAMQRSDSQAKSLGTAGMWATVALAVMCMFAGIIVFRRFVAKIVEPVAEIDGVLSARLVGDSHRRCRPLDAPVELRRIASAVNEILERSDAPVDDRASRIAVCDRAVMLHLVDALMETVVILGHDGETRARNAAAESILEDDAMGAVVRDSLSDVARGQGTGKGISKVTEIPGADAWLCILGRTA